MTEGISRIVKSGDGNTLLFVAIASAACANALPTPMDSVYFFRVSELKRQYEAGKISAETFEWHTAAEYYVWTSLWYVGIGALLLAMNNDYKNNIKFLFTLLAAGMVIGVVQKNVEKDKEAEAAGLASVPKQSTTQTK
jgi:predicted oxidoreductase (fatty acid repression mutant protein)